MVPPVGVAPARAHAPTSPAPCDAVTPAPSSTPAVPHADGRFTPILLVHGFTGRPDMWSKPVAGPVHAERSLLADLQALRGAVVYTLDYSAVGWKWFTGPDAGGAKFSQVV